jgi:GNAT superfamily N-acetyltransferase
MIEVENPPVILSRAEGDQQWQYASALLLSCAKQLRERQRPLWAPESLTEIALQAEYTLSELFFLYQDHRRIGLVFLQNEDPIYWPEKKGDAALYIHKLVVVPELVGKGIGKRAISCIQDYSSELGKQWLRLG